MTGEQAIQATPRSGCGNTDGRSYGRGGRRLLPRGGRSAGSPRSPIRSAWRGRLWPLCWRGSPLVDDAVLICSELASNAVLHSGSRCPGGEFVVRIEAHTGDYLWVEVEDQGGLWAGREATDESGRGLHIVATLAEEWGIEGDAQARVVWGRLT